MFSRFIGTLVAYITPLVWCAIAFLLFREFLLFLAVRQVHSAVLRLQSITQNTAKYQQACAGKTVIEEGGSRVKHFQVHFRDDRHFLLEAVCHGVETDPVVIDEKTLYPLAQKIPGSSGVIFGDARSEVGIEVLGRTKFIQVQGKRTTTSTTPSGSEVVPLSSCQGYGYRCCQDILELGQGDHYDQAIDCPSACFSQCVSQPTVLLFRTDPPPDTTTRKVMVHEGEPVTFAYIAGYDGKEDLSVVLTYGDGTQDTIPSIEGSTSHSYTCQTTLCDYTASIEVRTQTLRSIQAEVSKIDIRVIK